MQHEHNSLFFKLVVMLPWMMDREIGLDHHSWMIILFYFKYRKN